MRKAAVGCVVLSLQGAVALHELACSARHNTHSTLLCRMCLIRDGHFGAPRTSSRHISLRNMTISLRGGRSEILHERIENGKTQIQSEQLNEAHVVMRGVLTILAFTSFSSLLHELLIPFGVALLEFPSDNLFPVGQSWACRIGVSLLLVCFIAVFSLAAQMSEANIKESRILYRSASWPLATFIAGTGAAAEALATAAAFSTALLAILGVAMKIHQMAGIDTRNACYRAIGLAAALMTLTGLAVVMTVAETVEEEHSAAAAATFRTAGKTLKLSGMALMEACRKQSSRIFDSTPLRIVYLTNVLLFLEAGLFFGSLLVACFGAAAAGDDVKKQAEYIKSTFELAVTCSWVFVEYAMILTIGMPELAKLEGWKEEDSDQLNAQFRLPTAWTRWNRWAAKDAGACPGSGAKHQANHVQ